MRLARTWGFVGAVIIASVEFIQRRLSMIPFFCASVSGFGGTYCLCSALALALSFEMRVLS